MDHQTYQTLGILGAIFVAAAVMVGYGAYLTYRERKELEKNQTQQFPKRGK